MRRSVGWLAGGFFGLITAAGAQTAAPTASTPFDGTYAFVSASTVSETYTTATGRMGRCGQLRHVGPLSIANGQARYATGAGNVFDGTVTSGGQLAMRLAPRPGNKSTPGIEIGINGRIENDGMVTARQSGRLCSYDLVWRKQSQ
jgi:hypothetical protein